MTDKPVVMVVALTLTLMFLIGCGPAVGRATGEAGTTQETQTEPTYTQSEINALIDTEVSRKLSELKLEEWQFSVDNRFDEQTEKDTRFKDQIANLVYGAVSNISEGPQGPPGPQGPEGPQGRPGFNGSDGTIEDASIDDLDDGYVIWDMEGEISNLQSDISDLEDLVDDIAYAVENLDGDMYGYNGAISNLEDYLTTLGGDIETVYEAFNKHISSRAGYGGNHHYH